MDLIRNLETIICWPKAMYTAERVVLTQLKKHNI